MRRLSFLLLAFALALYGEHLITGAGQFVPFRLRDGLIVMALAALIFAAGATTLSSLDPGPGPRSWPWAGRFLFIFASVCGVMATLAASLAPAPVWFAGVVTGLWLVSIGLLAVSIWWPGEKIIYRRPVYRWSLDAAGRFVRLALGRETGDDGHDDSAHILIWPLLLVIGAGVILRIGRLATLPPNCTGAECARALELVNGSAGAGGSGYLFSWLAHLLFRMTGEGLYSLRLAAALLGIATLPLFFWLARPYARMGGAALLTMYFALSPWHIWAGRSSDPWIVAPLLICIALGAGIRALHSHDRRWWWAAGNGWGLLLIELPLLRAALLIWLFLLIGLSFLTMRREHYTRSLIWLHAPIPVVGALVVAGPVVMTAWRHGGAVQAAATAGPATTPTGMLSLLTGLLYGGGAPTVDFFLGQPLLAPLTAALTVLGIGYLVRYGWKPRPALALGGVIILGIAVVRADTGDLAPVSLLLVLLPLLYLAGAAALDQMLWAFQVAWHALVPAPRLLITVLVLVLVGAGWRAINLTQQLHTANSTAQDSVDVAMGRFLAGCLAQNSAEPCLNHNSFAGAPPIIFVPPAVLSSPVVRLLAGAALTSDRVHPLDVASDLLPNGAPTSDLVYLIPIDNEPLLSLLQQLYPFATIQAQPQNQAGPTLFVVFTVAQQDVLNRQGLQGRYFTGTKADSNQPAALHSQDGPLQFAWSQNPPLRAPFNAVWDGSLLIPAAGTYRFSLEPGKANGAGAPVLSLQLDGNLILDTSLGLSDKSEVLAQGAYHFTLRYHTDGPPSDWAVRWQPPGGQLEVIPRTALLSPALPNIGLVGTYFAGDHLQGPALTVRKDMVLGAYVELPRPFSVQWQGKLAAPRAGEYLFAVTADGFTQILIDGHDLLDFQPNTGQLDQPDYARSSIYLSIGWHTLEIRYIPQARQPNLRILWQPPGSSPALLPSNDLLPILADIHPGDAPLPPAPELVDARLGNDQFALSYTTDLSQPKVTVPPTDLPGLLAEQVWSAGSCGSGPNQLNAPHGVAIDGVNRRIYVADQGNHRVVAYNLKDGKQSAVYSDDQFQELSDIEIDPNGQVLALDAVASKIFHIDPATSAVTSTPLENGFYRPRGFSVDPSSDFLVADTGGARVALVNPDGQITAQFGSLQGALGKNQPADTLVAKGVMWAVTAEDGRLWRLDDLGSLAAIQKSNTHDGPHLAGLPDGTFFLSDPMGHTILYFAANGEPLAQFAYPDALIDPVGVGVAALGNLVYLAVSDNAACTVSLWRIPASSLKHS